MKKEYVKPNMLVVELRHRCQLLNVSEVSTVSGNSGMKYGGASRTSEEEEIIR